MKLSNSLIQALDLFADQSGAEVIVLVNGSLAYEASDEPVEAEKGPFGSRSVAGVEKLREANPEFSDRIPKWHLYNFMSVPGGWNPPTGLPPEYSSLLRHNVYDRFFPWGGHKAMEATKPSVQVVKGPAGRSFERRVEVPLKAEDNELVWAYGPSIDTEEEVLGWWERQVQRWKQGSGGPDFGPLP